MYKLLPTKRGGGGGGNSPMMIQLPIEGGQNYGRSFRAVKLTGSVRLMFNSLYFPLSFSLALSKTQIVNSHSLTRRGSNRVRYKMPVSGFSPPEIKNTRAFSELSLCRGKRHSESFSKYFLHIFFLRETFLKYVPTWREICIQFCDELSKRKLLSGKPYG